MNTLDPNTRDVVANLCAGIGLAARPHLPIDHMARCNQLHAEIGALADARACATAGDASTIYARIGGLIDERQAALQQLQQGGGL